MIKRYTHDEVNKIWTDDNKYKVWLDIELSICKAYEKNKVLPIGVYENIKNNSKINLKRIYELEAITKHEVVAFVNSIVEQVKENGAYFHYAVTSSDIMDTAFSKILFQSGEIILDELDKLMLVVKEKAFLYKDLICAGRTHGIHAEPMSFGLKFVSWYDELKRHKKRITKRLDNANICIISGAVGSYSLVDPEIEKLVAKDLNMNTHDVTSQVVSRDVYADLINAYALVGGCVERICVELRHLQRTELNEIIEEFTDGQTGSSAMPHKRNPISAENLTGCSRMLRGYAGMVLENQALWHERDISHSSVERVVGSDASILLAYMLKRLTGLISRISVNKANVDKNLKLTNGLIYSSIVLAELMKKGLSRVDAYKLTQDCARQIWTDKTKTFSGILKQDSKISKYLNSNDIDNIFNKNNMTNTDLIFNRVFDI